MRRGWVFLLALAFILALAAGTGAGLIHLYLSDLPQIRFLEEYRPSATTRIHDSSGALMAELFVERRKPVPYARISPLFVKAIVAVEDERFHEHIGVDFWAMLRALWADLASQSFIQGGSTITQQLTRNLFLESDKSLRRKVKEAVLAIQIENHYSKEEILELYCNQIYLGSGVYGVEAAAWKYFGRSAADLTLAQAALIAGLPKAPSAYDPLRYPERARQRRSVVLQRMLSTGALSRREYEDADKSPLGLAGSATGNEAPYFIEHLRQYLEETYGYNAVYQRGLEVHTTLDLNAQRHAESILRHRLRELDRDFGFRPATGLSRSDVDQSLAVKDLRPGFSFAATVEEAEPRRLKVQAGAVTGYIKADKDVFPHLPSFSGVIKPGQVVWVTAAEVDPKAKSQNLLLDQKTLIQGALVALNPRDGAVIAMVGGYDFSASQFNRALQAERQPGSAIKPFIYAAALEAGYGEASVIVDEPVKYWDPLKNDYWQPGNYDDEFWGETTLLEALTHSRNVVTVKLLNQLGVTKVTKLIRRFGIQSPMDANLSLALGTSGVNLLELTAAYGAFAAAGVRAAPRMITQVIERDGKVLEAKQSSLERVMSAEEAAVALDMLRSVVNHGTGRIALEVGYPVAAKTGTTDNYQDAWFVGFSPEVAAGVWVGYDDNRPMGRGATGSRMAGPIWTAFMSVLPPPADDFHMPEDVVFAEIDVKTGLLAGPGCGDNARRAAFVKGTEPRKVCRHDIPAAGR